MAKNMRAAYIALCEMKVDFNKDKKGRIKLKFGFIKTVATYAGLCPDTTRQALKMLEELGIVNYGKGKSGVWFILPEFKYMNDKNNTN